MNGVNTKKVFPLRDKRVKLINSGVDKEFNKFSARRVATLPGSIITKLIEMYSYK